MDIKDILQLAKDQINKASSLEEIEKARLEFLGRKGKLTEILRGLAKMSLEQKKKIGGEANLAREDIELLLKNKAKELRAAGAEKIAETEKVDITLPGLASKIGHRHPLQLIKEKYIEIFTSFGYTLFNTPEIETEEFNFDLLNIPQNHPARDMWDTFFVKGNGYVLRTHTSPFQIHCMKKNKPPLRFFAFGRVYRYEQIDAGHSPNFYQCEGLVVDKNITLADLKGTIQEFAKQMFGHDVKSRMRQSFFPFTEPSVEVDVTCAVCGGKGCPVCKGTGWVEIIGAGMVHPNVLRNVGLNPAEWQGFAFGMGVDRICMLKYGIEDIRLLYSNNLKFLEQF